MDMLSPPAPAGCALSPRLCEALHVVPVQRLHGSPPCVTLALHGGIGEAAHRNPHFKEEPRWEKEVEVEEVVGSPQLGPSGRDSVVNSGSLSPTPCSNTMEGGGLLSTGKSTPARHSGSKLETVNFGKLDFGETMVLDSFYNA
ncbi:hypothetical protein KUCAC02_020207, partial [Chaenocephalus aceratus]